MFRYQDNWIGAQAIALLKRKPEGKPWFFEVSHQARETFHLDFAVFPISFFFSRGTLRTPARSRHRHGVICEKGLVAALHRPLSGSGGST
jgi:hypothetical protein